VPLDPEESPGFLLWHVTLRWQRQIAAALALGAAGVWMGSAWLATEEYATTTSAPAVTDAVLNATSSDTVRSRIYSGKPARLLKNRWTDAWEQPGAPEPLAMPLQNLLVSEAHQRLIRSGRPEVVPMPAGQIVGRTAYLQPAHVMASADIIGQVLPVRIDSLERYSLLGELAAAPHGQPAQSAFLQMTASQMTDSSQTRMGA